MSTEEKKRAEELEALLSNDEKWTNEELERKKREIREEERRKWIEICAKMDEWIEWMEMKERTDGLESYDVRNGWKEILQMLREDRIRRYRLLQKAKEETAHIRPLPRELRMGWRMMRERRDINIDLRYYSIDEGEEERKKKQELEARLREVDAHIRLLPREHRTWLEGKMDVWLKWRFKEAYEEPGFPLDKEMEAKVIVLVESMLVLEYLGGSEPLAIVEEELLGERYFYGKELDELDQEMKESTVLCDEIEDYLAGVWLAREWKRYLEIRELMLRKTRSPDMSRLIMSFC